MHCDQPEVHACVQRLSAVNHRHYAKVILWLDGVVIKVLGLSLGLRQVGCIWGIGLNRRRAPGMGTHLRVPTNLPTES